MEFCDDDLLKFEAEGAACLPASDAQGCIENKGAEIWYYAYGSGLPVILLHGGFGHAGNWGYQVPALVENGYRAILIDSRGHGRSTRDAQPYSYELMASDVSAVMDTLQIEKAALAGWSDGADTALIFAMKAPSRVSAVFFFACNVDDTGLKEIEPSPLLERCFARHTKDYARLSKTPDQFKEFVGAVQAMQSTQPNLSAQQLASIHVPVTVVLGEHDEFIRREHTEYMAGTLPNAELIILNGVMHEFMQHLCMNLGCMN